MESKITASLKRFLINSEIPFETLASAVGNCATFLTGSDSTEADLNFYLNKEASRLHIPCVIENQRRVREIIPGVTYQEFRTLLFVM